MNIDFKDEYATLRQEMLGKFDRIHDTTKYGIGGFILFLSYYWHNYPILNSIVALLVLQFIIALLGLSVLQLYKSIYIKGTYIAIVIERTTGPRWHRMNRLCYKYKCSSNGYIKKQSWAKEQLDRIFQPKRKKWGSDSAQHSIIILALNIIAIVVVIMKTSDSSKLIIWEQLINLLFIMVNLSIFYKLRFGMEKFRKKTEKIWKNYCKDFGIKFKDLYN